MARPRLARMERTNDAPTRCPYASGAAPPGEGVRAACRGVRLTCPPRPPPCQPSRGRADEPDRHEHQPEAEEPGDESLDDRAFVSQAQPPWVRRVSQEPYVTHQGVEVPGVDDSVAELGHRPRTDPDGF